MNGNYYIERRKHFCALNGCKVEIVVEYQKILTWVGIVTCEHLCSCAQCRDCITALQAAVDAEYRDSTWPAKGPKHM